ncbi:site-specific integrase [Telluribacter sp. SYSU D00476]|uniref:site-specific integrase n=1 Tax=Telluribacter sp. SYSU D00476 TaxID=2811430 RepID=UPI001FF588B9|nr:site-specific integrase [Telluribacter sp. SYSU D00476]
MKTATVTLFHDKRRGDNSIKLYLTFERKQRLYSTGFKADLSTWKRLKDNEERERPDGKIKDEEFLHLWAALWNRPDKYDKSKALGLVHIARDIASQLGPNFTHEKFKELLDNYGKVKVADANDLIAALRTKGERLKSAGQISNGTIYELVAKSINRFLSTLDRDDRKELGLPLLPTKTSNELPTLQFQHITKDFLTLYEQWMLVEGKAPHSPKKAATGASPTTISIYCRALRAVFNDALEAHTIKPEEYPFGRNKYIIPAAKNIKKALSKEEVRRLISYQCMPGMEQRGRDLWVFSYFSNGMNIADICRLRWKDIDFKEQTLTFIRQKTSHSRKTDQTKVKVVLNPETLAILERWGSSPKTSKGYVFPFIREGMTPDQHHNAIKQVTKMTNKYVKRIAQAVGITADITSYYARHSFATILLQSEAPLAFISQSLGHTNIKTTESYLGSFDDEKTKKYLEALL